MDTNNDYDPSEYERPSVTVDILLFAIRDNRLNLLLIKRALKPFQDHWALPGGFIQMDESLEAAALRELAQESGVKDVYLEQLYTFGHPKRDPRTRVITVAYYALIPSADISLNASSDAKEVGWFPVDTLPELAFDHQAIIDYALNRLRNKIEYSNIVFGLLPEKFRLSEIQKVYEIILGKDIDKRNFRKWILSLNLLERVGERERSGAHRPAELYRFKTREPIAFS